MKYWASCEKFTVQVNVDDAGLITWTAPIVQRFVGQQFDNLRRWMTGLGGAVFLRMQDDWPLDPGRHRRLRQRAAKGGHR